MKPLMRTDPKMSLFYSLVGSLLVLSGVSCSHSGPPEPITELHGLTAEQVTEQLGQPRIQYDLRFQDLDNPFREPVKDHLPPGDWDKREGIIVKEWRWSDGEYHIAVWFRQTASEWTAIDSLRWHESIAF